MRYLSTKRRPTDRTRGQSLVEFALVLPILLFLTVIALDFGRIYLGWVNLQSMTRIAANFAAGNPQAWTGAGDPDVQTQYQSQIKNDAVATNCQLPLVSGVRTAPAPVFAGTDVGDTVTVSMSCTFDVITPGISAVLGGHVTVSSSASFPVSTGMTATGGPGGAGHPPSAAFTSNAVQAPSTLSCSAPCTVDFRDTSGGDPNEWHWDFADGEFSGLQDVLGHVFEDPGTYVVLLTVTNGYGSSTETMGISVSAVSDADFTFVQSSPNAPATVDFTDASTAGATAWDWTFGTGEGTGTGATVSHTYTTPGTYTVTLTVTYPTGTDTASKTVTVGSNLCLVPSLKNLKRNNAQAAWNNAGFSGTVSDGPNAPNGNYTITSQTVTSSSFVPCNSDVQVNNP